MSENATLKYIHKDHLGGTYVVTSDNGTLIEVVKYYSFGETRVLTGADVTEKLFTGQRLDDTGLYYYNARYYDPTIGRFISPDTIVPNFNNPQSFNRYSYCLNNPLGYKDPSGHDIMNNGYCIDGVNVNNIEEYVFSNQAMGIFLDVEVLVAVAVFREETSYDPYLIDTLERTERNISIEFGDIGTQNNNFERDGNNINIILDSGADASYSAYQMLNQVYDFLVTSAPLVNSNTVYDVVSMVPFGKIAKGIGKALKAEETIKREWNFLNACKSLLDAGGIISNAQTKQASGWQTTASVATFIGGFTVIAPLCCAYNLVVDLNNAQQAFNNGVEERGGYEFR